MEVCGKIDIFSSNIKATYTLVPLTRMKNHFLYFVIFLTLFACKTDQTEPSSSTPLPFQKSIGGTSDDIANSVIVEDNLLYVYGQTKSLNDPSGDHYLIKLDLLGNVLFEKTYGGALTEEGTKIITTNDGNFILIGTTESSGSGQKDVHVLKIDKKGVLLWEKTFGGSLDDFPIDIIETSKGEFCIAATTQSFGSGASDMYLLWISQDGDLIHHATYGGQNIDGCSGVLEIENNELMVYGFTRNFGANSRDLYLIKLTSTGDSLWSKRYGGDGYEESQGFARTIKGGFLFNGHSSSTDPNHDMYAVEVDINGHELWENNYGGNLHDGGQTLLIHNEGNYVFIARSMSFGNGDRDIYMVITNSSGDIISEKIIGGSKNDWGQDIIVHNSFYYIVGHSNSYTGGDNDVFIVKLKQ